VYASKVVSWLCRSFFGGLLVDIADRFELLREHQQGRLQVDEAPGVCARANGAGCLDRWLALDVDDPLSERS
jgi:hypothetical protein